ncbi:MAG: FAD-dependent oxidoreductase [Chthonomonas sp.]|nr:FAD-dependent oxidoreductase [Chthonomonas sp.]
METKAFDVIVVGGGTAGTAACISAAKAGAKTLVVEQLGSLGGTQSNGWVTPMMPNYLGQFKLDRGINLDLIAAQNALQPSGPDVDHGDVWYDPTMMAMVMDRVATQAGVIPLFNSTLTDVKRNGPAIEAIEVVTRSGRFWISGKAFIDTTGDGELSALAGAELMGGNEDGVHQPMTLRFKMGNVDIERMRNAYTFWRLSAPKHLEYGIGELKEDPILGPYVHEAIKLGILAEDDLGYFQMFMMNGCPGEIAFNAPRISDLDPLDPWELSRAYQVGREKIYRIAAFLRRYFVGFEQAFVSGIAPLMGIRESRRVVGEYVLTAEDHLGLRKFEDAVARNRYPIDIHLKTGIDYRKFPPGEYHEIPYRSLVVKGFNNLWVAGRCLSADFVAQSAVRIQPVCRSMGEAAGAAAALCAAKGLAAQALPYADLRAHLDLSIPEQVGASS